MWLAEVSAYKLVRATEPDTEVRGVVLLENHLYVVRKNSSQIDVLHPMTLTPAASIPVPGLTNPGSMAGCAAQKSLFITCFRQKEVLKVHVTGTSQRLIIWTWSGFAVSLWQQQSNCEDF